MMCLLGLTYSIVLLSATIPSAQAADFSEYGYPYYIDAAKGWLFQPPPVANSTSFHEDVTVATECTEICQQEQAVAGGWNSRDSACWCYFDPVCLEPCVEEQGVEFSSRPYSKFSYCEQSFCEYFGDENSTNAWYCSEQVGFDPQACQAKKANLPASPDLSDDDFAQFGFLYSQDSAKGFLVDSISTPDNFTYFDNVFSAETCAKTCERENALGGAWNSRLDGCFCYFALECLEPCIEEPGTEFSTLPFSEFSFCEKSICEYFSDELAEYCAEVGFDVESCTNIKDRQSNRPQV